MRTLKVMTQTPGTAIDAIGRQVVANITELSKARRLSFRQLSERLGQIGRPILPSVLHALSAGKRRVDADDLVAFAIALGVNPNALLAPRHEPPGEPVQLTPEIAHPAGEVWAWLDGRAPLPGDHPNRAMRAVEFHLYAHPDSAAAGSHPVVDELLELKWELETILADPADTALYARNRMAIIRRFRLAALQLEQLLSGFDQAAMSAGALTADQEPLGDAVADAIDTVRGHP